MTILHGVDRETFFDYVIHYAEEWSIRLRK